MVSTITVIAILLVCGVAILVGLLVLWVIISQSKRQKMDASKQAPISTQQTKAAPESSPRDGNASQQDGGYKRCAACGHNNPSAHNFCEQCGEKL